MSDISVKLREAGPEVWFCMFDFDEPRKASVALSALFNANRAERRKYQGPHPKVRWEYRAKTNLELSTPAEIKVTSESITGAAPARSDAEKMLTVAAQYPMSMMVRDHATIPSMEKPALDPFADLAAAITRIVDQRIEVAIGKVTEALIAAAPTPAEESANALRKAMGRKQKQKVLIVGLLGHLFQRIKKEYGDELDLRLCDPDDVKTSLAAMAKGMDKVIVMTKFISHNVNELVRDHSGVMWCQGGVTELEKMLVEVV